ncbi:MAG: discoidin domain-containing protein, partial [Planctomycetes bacterium]|nr:discoidin domain-containing protein [Planctomycetota bacterium]
MATSTAWGQFSVPLRINCGGPEITDSNGNTWLADEGVNADPLDIRPNDLGGAQAIPAWANPNPASVAALGFGGTAEDVNIFRSIRWDVGGDADDWHMEIPIPNGEYTVNFYLCEAGGDGRHYSLWLEDAVVEEDAHSLAFPVGEGIVPGQNIAGRYSFETEVVDGSLHVGLTPPPAGTPGAADINAILNALEILPLGFDPCDDPTVGRCATGARCEQVWERTDGGLDGVDLGENIALGGIATQSSEGWGGAPGRAIDGNTDGIWGSGSTTHTNNPGAPSWWEVDLLDTYDIDTIRLWNRLDCCSERLTNFTIEVIAADRSVKYEGTILRDTSRLSGPNITAERLAT